MERKVSVYPFPFGTRVFMHRNGVIREAEYRGMRIKDTGICGNNVDTEHIFWFGSKLGEEKFKVSMPIYKTAEDAAQETNPVQYEVLNIESFSLKYLPYIVWDGIQLCGWLWDGSRPVKRATREPLRVCKIYGGKVTFVDYSGNEYYAEHFRRFYQTAKQCREANKPKIVMLDELHLTKEDIIKNIEPLLEKHVKRYMVNTYGGDNQIENWIRCMVNDELKQRDHDFVRRACENVIRNHVLNELNIIVRSKSEKCTCENRVPSEEDKKESTDGLYIIYKDGHAEPFTGHNSKDCVRYIGLKHRYMSFAISLTEHDIVQLLDDDSREESGSGTYYERECDALFDIDGRGNTERLVTRNPKLRNLLENGEYIPSLGQLNLMAHYMNELNKAFAYVSASPLSSTWYWSSTESSQAVAWYVVFSSGLTGTGNKHIGDMVRAVIDF